MRHRNNWLSGKKLRRNPHLYAEGEQAPSTHLISSDHFSVQAPCHRDAACVLIDSENSFRFLIHSLASEPELGPFRSVTVDYLDGETE